jgi:hypothetical protein
MATTVHTRATGTARRRGWLLALGSIVGLALALPVAATLRTVERAYEVDPAQLLLPPSATGPLRVRPCANCRPVNLVIGPDTVWQVGVQAGRSDRPAFLQQFRAAAADRNALVYVFYRPGSSEVTRLVLDRPAATAVRPVATLPAGVRPGSNPRQERRP